MSFRIIFALFVSLSLTAQAESVLKAGTYIREGGSGILILSREAHGDLAFTMNAVGINAHTCSVEGKISNGKAIMKEDDGEGVCRIFFTPHVRGIEVDGKDKDNDIEGGYCRYYCGMRAFFSGLYLTPEKGCTPDALEKTRKKFKALYDRRLYVKARNVLKPVLSNCKDSLNDLYEEGAIRNDLAVTYYKLGDYDACRTILEPYADDAMEKESDIEAYGYAPSDREAYLMIISAARVNLKLCDKAEETALKKKKP